MHSPWFRCHPGLYTCAGWLVQRLLRMVLSQMFSLTSYVDVIEAYVLFHIFSGRGTLESFSLSSHGRSRFKRTSSFMSFVDMGSGRLLFYRHLRTSLERMFILTFLADVEGEILLVPRHYGTSLLRQ